MRVLVWAGSALIGGVGALLRFALDGAVSERARSEFPWGTLAVNISGAFVLGLFAGLALHGDALLLAGTALLGSYTTFSTWMFETHRLAEEGASWAAVLNVVRQPRPRDRGRRARADDRRCAVNEDCLKLSVYFGERDRAGGAFLADALLDLFARHGLRDERAAARRRGLRRQAAAPDPAPAEPVRGPARWWRWRWTRASGSSALLPEVTALTGDGLVTLERARLLTGESGRPRSRARRRS